MRVEPCCPSCQGTGSSHDPETGGRCWDCRGTGHTHEGPCLLPELPAETPPAGTLEARQQQHATRHAARIAATTEGHHMTSTATPQPDTDVALPEPEAAARQPRRTPTEKAKNDLDVMRKRLAAARRRTLALHEQHENAEEDVITLLAQVEYLAANPLLA